MYFNNNTAWLDIEPKRMKRNFIKEYKDGGIFQTVQGETNVIEKIDTNYIYVRCKNKDATYKISREALNRAINQLYFRKSIKRSDLANICNFNTALFAILITIFKNKITVEKDQLNKKSWRILLKGVRYIPSGMTNASAKDWATMKRLGIKIIMISFAHVKKTVTWYAWCIALNMYAVVDSGAFTIARQGGEVCIYSYAEFVKKYKSRIQDFINLDVIGDAEASRRNFNLLKELTGMSPVPVWHPSQEWEYSNWDELEEMVNNNELVAIGGTHPKIFIDKDDSKKKALFKYINKLYPYTKFHLMGGSSMMILEDTWLYGQTDSTGWIHARKNKQTYTFKNGKATIARPNYVTSLESTIYSLNMLSSFERTYGNYNIILNRINKFDDLNRWLQGSHIIVDSILDGEPLIKLSMKQLRKQVKMGTFIDTIGQLRFLEESELLASY